MTAPTTPVESAAVEGHTPGPWAVEPDTGTIWGPAPCADTRGWGFKVADAHLPRSRYDKHIATDGARNANARLIAAAPELLTALTGLLANLTEGDFISETRIDAARAAIAKATGGGK